MNSFERLTALMTGQPVDRPGISTYELVGWNSDDFACKEPSYNKLMERIRNETDCMYRSGGVCGPDIFGCKETVKEWKEGVSFFRTIITHTPKGDLTRRYRTDDNIHTTWTLEHQLKTIDDIDKYLSIPWEAGAPHPEKLTLARERLGGTRGIPKFSLSDPICTAAELFEFGQFTIYSNTDRDRILELLDIIHERNMIRYKALAQCKELKGTMCRIVGPEYCTPPFMSPKLFDRFVGVYLDEMIDVLKKAGVFCRVHSHGKVKKTVDRIVAAGAQGLDPCEPLPDGDISLKDLRAKFPDLLLLGGVELHELERSTRARMKEVVVDCLEQAATGPFILMPTAAPINTPLSKQTEDNYNAMIDAFHEWCGRH
ncbi:MAG: uroporphyrinogen decarboxylase family protein [Planctomycetota bacterium]